MASIDVMISKNVVVALAVLFGAGCAAPSKVFTVPALDACNAGDGKTEKFRLVSFNIRSGLSSSIEKVGDVIAEMNPDVVALQEVDVGVARTNRADQAAELAQRLGMKHVFAGAIKREGGDYGIALLSRLPLTRATRVDLKADMAYEPRVAIDASVCVNGKEVRVVAVHADVFPWSAAANSHQLARKLAEGSTKPMIVAGDLNATPNENAPRAFTVTGLVDILKQRAEGPTFVGSNRRLDYILADKELDLEVSGAGKVDTQVSDHVPVFADFSTVTASP